MLEGRYDLNPKSNKRFISGLNSGVYHKSSKNMEEKVERPKGDLIEVTIPASERKNLLESERKMANTSNPAGGKKE